MNTSPTADLEDKFVGKRIGLNVTTQKITVLGTEHVVTNYEIDTSDSTYQKLKAAVEARYSRVRFILPGTMHTMEFLQNRVNIQVGKKGKINRIYMG